MFVHLYNYKEENMEHINPLVMNLILSLSFDSIFPPLFDGIFLFDLMVLDWEKLWCFWYNTQVKKPSHQRWDPDDQDELGSNLIDHKSSSNSLWSIFVTHHNSDHNSCYFPSNNLRIHHHPSWSIIIHLILRYHACVYIYIYIYIYIHIFQIYGLSDHLHRPGRRGGWNVTCH